MQHFRILAFCLILTLSACGERNPAQLRWQPAIDGAYAAAISNDGTLAVISSINDGLSLWDLRKQQRIHQWTQSDSDDQQAFVISFAPNGSFVISATHQQVWLWHTEQSEPLGHWFVSESSIRDVAVSQAGRYLVLGLGNGKVLHIDRQTGRRLEFLGHSERINSLSLSPNGRYVLSGGNDHLALLWDSQSAQVLRRFEHKGRVSKVGLSDNGQFAFSADNTNEAIVWQLPSGEKLSQLDLNARQRLFSSLRFSDDGEWLLTGEPSRHVTLWHSRSGQALQSWKVSAATTHRPRSAVVYSAALLDKAQVISASSSGFIEQWAINE